MLTVEVEIVLIQLQLKYKLAQVHHGKSQWIEMLILVMKFWYVYNVRTKIQLITLIRHRDINILRHLRDNLELGGRSLSIEIA